MRLVAAGVPIGPPSTTLVGIMFSVDVQLAAHGIAVHAGAKFSTGKTSAVRVATSILSEEHLEHVANSVALAAGPAREVN
ncbi:hypothetical protein [Mesorhizobium sp. M0816]|uniref:hypothetical protein n=1 Tax=Mesorhizobium sp. M0816 TaxID=2957006 RepID=UPI003336B89C